MIDINDIQPLSHFKRNTPAVVRHIKKTGRPMVLTIDGKAELVVMDKEAYQGYLSDKERLEMIAFLDETDEDIRIGNVIPARKAVMALGKRKKK